jgi:imidazolonepropionase-like amidohydrolase
LRDLVINPLFRFTTMIGTSIHYFMLATLLALLVACRAADREDLQSVSLVVTNGIIVDGTGANPFTDGLIAIRGNRIVAVGQSADFKIPKDIAVIDAAGGTILPGVINSHAHKVATAATRRHLFLLDGVTSVCDLGDSLSRMQEFEQEESFSGPAARGFNAGPIVTLPDGYPGPPVIYEIQDEVAAEHAVVDLHTRRADFIKVALEPGPLFNDYFPVLNLQELRSIVTTAHALGLLVRAHVYNSSMLDIALEAGVDVIEHVPMPYDSNDNLVSMFDDTGNFHMPSELEAQLLRMLDQGVVLVPTLAVLDREPDSYVWGDIGVEWEEFIQANLGVVRFFHSSGGIIAVGNDYGVPGVQPGMPLRELDLLLTAGLSPLEVVEAGTKHAAYVCGQSNELGTLEIGKLADLIVVDGNPLDDLDAMDSVLYIVKDGELVFSSQQDRE